MTNPGYWIENNVLTAEECDPLIESLGSRAANIRAGTRHLMRHPAVAGVANDPRLLQLARSALGAGAVPFKATLFAKSDRANWLVVWHQDTVLPLESRNGSPEWGPWSTKEGILYAHAPAWALSRVLALRLHLDASTSENGPLRVIPESHVNGVLTDEEVFRRAKVEKTVDCLVARGSVIAMRPLLIHSSSKAQSTAPRRVLHIEYADALELAPGIRLAMG